MRHFPNKEIYDFVKKNNVVKAVVSIGEYDNEYDVNVMVYYWDRNNNYEYKDFTPQTLDSEGVAEKQAKGIYRTLCNYCKSEYAGIENC